MRSVLLFRYRYGISFPFPPYPPPPRLLSPICLLRLVPPPPGVGGVGCCRFAAAGMASVCLLASLSCRSLASARSLLLSGSPCGAYCLPVPLSSSSACSSLAGGCGYPASRLPRRLAARPASRFPVPPSCPPDGEGMAWCCRLLACLFVSSGLLRCARASVRFLFLCRVRCRDVCGELTRTARMPIIGWRRFSFLCHQFSFSRHLVFDTG